MATNGMNVRSKTYGVALLWRLLALILCWLIILRCHATPGREPWRACERTYAFGHGELNRLVHATDHLQHRTEFRYDAGSRCDRVTDARTKATELAYNGLGFPTGTLHELSEGSSGRADVAELPHVLGRVMA